jgi:hypothetical protein
MTLNAGQLRHLSGVFAKMADLAQEAEALLARPVALDVKGVLARNPVPAAEPAPVKAARVDDIPAAFTAKPAAASGKASGKPNPISREAVWTPEEIDRAIDLIVKAMAAGKTKTNAYHFAGAEIGRSYGAMQARFRGKAADRLNAAIIAAGVSRKAHKHFTGEAPAGRSGGPWTAEEDEKIRAAIRALPGMSAAFITKRLSKELDRTPLAITNRISHNILPAMKGEKAPKSAPSVAPVAAPVVQKPAAPSPAVAPVSAAFMPPPDGLPIWQRDLRLAINAIGYPEGHDAETDLELVEELSRGRKVAAVAEDLGLTEAVALARFKALREAASFDRPFGLTEQHRLIDELRARVVIARGAA